MAQMLREAGSASRWSGTNRPGSSPAPRL